MVLEGDMNTFLYTSPAPASLVAVANEHGRQGPKPREKDAKKPDLFRRKIFSTGGL